MDTALIGTPGRPCHIYVRYARIDLDTFFFLKHGKVEKKFRKAWKVTGTPPTIKNVYKIIESWDFLRPYDRYK